MITSHDQLLSTARWGNYLSEISLYDSVTFQRTGSWVEVDPNRAYDNGRLSTYSKGDFFFNQPQNDLLNHSLFSILQCTSKNWQHRVCTRQLRSAVDYLGVLFCFVFAWNTYELVERHVVICVRPFFYFSFQLERSKPNKYPSKSEVTVELLTG